MRTCACGCGRVISPRAKNFIHGHHSRLRPRKIVTKVCPTCGQDFSGPPSIMRQRTHCSMACRSRRISYRCEGCGEWCEARACEIGRRFCGNVCRLIWFSRHFVGEASPQWQGGAIDYYGPSWDTARRAARERDGFRCQDCGIHERDLPEQLSVAHAIPFRLFELERHEEANALENLRSLCRPCHLRFDHADGSATAPGRRTAHASRATLDARETNGLKGAKT